MTCSTDRHDHVVDEWAIARGHGRVPAVCGHLVLAASLTEPPAAPCPRCLDITRFRRQSGRHAARGSLHGRT